MDVEREAFVQERTVMKQEIVDLHNKLAIATAEVSMSGCQCSIIVHLIKHVLKHLTST